ncbi:ATP12 family chaperone protein [Parerythrobacter aestuarii]|uniref:ATP12 family chaperone protein n=1 Tax=Parerythrobacter aestuarii TaxID=3020909 RepID=UPI0024DED9F7|nr:ATP12 family protein [Parerythrobacter aestuarii]
MKRFWKDVSVGETGAGWQVLLDGRPIRTQGKRPQAVPSRTLCEMLAGEWAAQGEKIDPVGFKHRDMADYAIDMIATKVDDIPAKLQAFFETDTLCYRADPDEPLFKRQQEVWEPIVVAFEAREKVNVERASGIIHKPQNAQARAMIGSRIENMDPFLLAPLFATTSLAASLIIGLTALEDDANPEALWDAASLEEDWQVELWGEDHESTVRRERRLADFRRAMEFARAVRT